MQAGFKFVGSFDEGVEKVVNGTFAFLNSEAALRLVLIICNLSMKRYLYFSLGLSKMTKTGYMPHSCCPKIQFLCLGTKLLPSTPT